MVILKFCGGPTHEFKVAVAAKLPVMAAPVAFSPVNEAIFPGPGVPIPIVPLLLVQATVAPAALLTKFIAAVFALAQTVWLAIAVKVGKGSTLILKFTGVPTQVLNVGVAVKFPV